MTDKIRCSWAQSSQLEKEYHDAEWGVPVHEDKILFEFLILEGAQAGLSWSTVLNKREGYRQALDDFDVQKISNYGEDKIAELLNNPGIIRNKLKVNSTITNARLFTQVQKEFGSFDSYIWQFVGGKPILNAWTTASQVPITSPESDAMSKDLKKRGFKFIGSTICYAYMQAMGMVNDHSTDCFCYASSK